MIIIGLTGTLGAGKGTIADYLAKHKDFRLKGLERKVGKARHQLRHKRLQIRKV